MSRPTPRERETPTPASVTAYPDGPAMLRGDAELLVDGEPVARGRRMLALCRCGASTIKPLCDGTHKAIGFRTGESAPVCQPLEGCSAVEYEDAIDAVRPPRPLRESA